MKSIRERGHLSGKCQRIVREIRLQDLEDTLSKHENHNLLELQSKNLIGNDMRVSVENQYIFSNYYFSQVLPLLWISVTTVRLCIGYNI